jgi:two-component sensor histidine kinase
MGVPRSSSEILRLRLQCDPSAPGQVRRALERLDAVDSVRDDALLVASELATNALRHVCDNGGGALEVTAELVPDGLRIAVSDTCEPEALSGPRPVDAPEPDGLGLRIVQAIAHRWGAERFDGQRTWAVVPVP